MEVKLAEDASAVVFDGASAQHQALGNLGGGVAQRSQVQHVALTLGDFSDGAPVLLELELTEPSFFLWTDPSAAARVARAVRGWA